MVERLSGDPVGRSGHTRARLLFGGFAGVCAAVLVLGSGAPSALAQGSAALPCHALLMRPESAELARRIAGQSQDVACSLELTANAIEVSSDAALQEAAHAAHANAVIAIEHGDAYDVLVWHADTQTREQRAVNVTHAEGDTLGESAAFEAIALVVRSALVDLAALQVEKAQREATARALLAQREGEARAKAQAVKDAREASAAAQRSEDAASAAADASPPKWLLLAGGEIAAIGAGEPAFALSLRALHDLGGARIGAALSFGFPATLEDASTSIELRRHAGVLLLGLPMHVSSRVTLDASLTTGLVAIERSTRARLSTVSSAQGGTAWSAIFGLETGAALRLFGPLALRLQGALEVVPGAPSYAYEDVYLDASRRTERKPAALLQPRAGVLLSGQF